VWLLPVGLPLLLSIPMTVLTSKVKVGTAMRAHNYLLIPEETSRLRCCAGRGSTPASWRGRCC
jgi:membrane glycosyltransferase